MTQTPTQRLGRTIGWLLTPFVVWAAAFLGGWIGTVIRTDLAWLIGGAAIGGTGGLVGWSLMMRSRRAPP